MNQTTIHPDVMALIRANLRQRQVIENARRLLKQPRSKLTVKDYKRLLEVIEQELDGLDDLGMSARF